MMKTNPITPPPELVEQWEEQWCDMPVIRPSINSYIATQAAQWGADQEMKACCLLLDDGEHSASYGCHNGTSLRAARRPKPPSLKAQALQAAQRFYANGHEDCNDEEVKDDFDIIRRALESLPD